MIRPPSPARADKTMEGDEYASDVTQMQWNVYVVKRNATMQTTPNATWKVWLRISFLNVAEFEWVQITVSRCQFLAADTSVVFFSAEWVLKQGTNLIFHWVVSFDPFRFLFLSRDVQIFHVRGQGGRNRNPRQNTHDRRQHQHQSNHHSLPRERKVFNNVLFR